MHDESIIDVAIAWFLLGVVVGTYVLIKIGILAPTIADSVDVLSEPRVTIDSADPQSN